MPPSFYLPPCPICSTLLTVERPSWRFAHNTSRARGVKCYIFSGCAHAAIMRGAKIVADEDAISCIEDIWAHQAEQLFAEKTARWTEVERERFRRAMEDRHFIPGAVEELALEPMPEPKRIAVTANPPRAAFVMDSERDF